MKTVVITGSTKGIGLGLAKEFLKRGCNVAVSARNRERLENVRSELSTAYDAEKITACPCDVTDYGQVQNLWNEAAGSFGRVDIWINNAGLDNTTVPFWELDPSEIETVTRTNVTGLMYGTHVSLNGMLRQGSGQIYSMLGFGSDDMMRTGFSVYGTSKRAVRYFTETLIEETKDTPVQICFMSPGMVVTDFLIDGLRTMPPEAREESKAIYNLLADTVETITPFLVEEALKNDTTGTKIAWLTEEKAQARFQDPAYLERDLFEPYGL